MLVLVRGKNKRIFTTRSYEDHFRTDVECKHRHINVSNRLMDKNLVTICVWREHHTTIWNGTCFVSSTNLLCLVSLEYNRRHRVPFCGSQKLVSYSWHAAQHSDVHFLLHFSLFWMFLSCPLLELPTINFKEQPRVNFGTSQCSSRVKRALRKKLMPNQENQKNFVKKPDYKNISLPCDALHTTIEHAM
jgi:hypothetical protein